MKKYLTLTIMAMFFSLGPISFASSNDYLPNCCVNKEACCTDGGACCSAEKLRKTSTCCDENSVCCIHGSSCCTKKSSKVLKEGSTKGHHVGKNSEVKKY